MVGGLAALMWLATDHVHIYVETDGEKPLEAIAKKLKVASSKAIIKMVPGTKEKPGKGGELWDKAYFLETIG